MIISGFDLLLMVQLLISVMGRLMFGVGTVYPRTDDRYFTNQNLFRKPVAFT